MILGKYTKQFQRMDLILCIEDFIIITYLHLLFVSDINGNYINLYYLYNTLYIC